MAYFNLRCVDPQKGKYILIVLNVIVAILGVNHWAYTGVFGNFITYGKDDGIIDQSQKIVYRSQVAYYVISGIFQILVSIIIVLLILEKIGQERRLLWVRLVMGMLILEYGFSFFIAVYASMMASYWKILVEDKILQALSGDLIAQDPIIQDFYDSILAWTNFNKAEAILTWLVAIPSITTISISFVDQLITQENVNNMVKANTDSTTKTNIQVNPISQNSMVDINPSKK